MKWAEPSAPLVISVQLYFSPYCLSPLNPLRERHQLNTQAISPKSLPTPLSPSLTLATPSTPWPPSCPAVSRLPVLQISCGPTWDKHGNCLQAKGLLCFHFLFGYYLWSMNIFSSACYWCVGHFYDFNRVPLVGSSYWLFSFIHVCHVWKGHNK